MQSTPRLAFVILLTASFLVPGVYAGQAGDSRPRAGRMFKDRKLVTKADPKVRAGRAVVDGRDGASRTKDSRQKDSKGQTEKERPQTNEGKGSKVKDRSEWPSGRKGREQDGGKKDKGKDSGTTPGGRPGGGEKPPSDDVDEQEPETPSQGDGKDPKDPRPGRPPHGGRPRPRPHRPPIVVTIPPFWGDRDRDDRDQGDKTPDEDDGEKADDENGKDKGGKKKNDSEPEPTPLVPQAEPGVQSAQPRPLKYDGGAYRTMIGSLLAGNHISAALKVLELLKEKEYFDYTGEYEDQTAGLGDPGLPRTDVAALRPARATGLADGFPAGVTASPSEQAAQVDSWAVGSARRVAARSGSGQKQDDWESVFEKRADKVLSLSREVEALEKAGAGGTPEDQERLAKLREKLAGATQDLDGLIEGLSAELGRKDGRVKRLKASEDLMVELGRLGSGVAALYTITTEDRYWLVLVTPTERKAYSYSIAGAELNRKVMEFRETLRNPKLDPLPLAGELYHILFEPAARDLRAAGAQTLMWSFDGVLRYVPVVALHDGQRYLVESYRNVVFTRASISRLRDEPTRPWTGVGLGVSRKIGEFRPLPAVADELRGIFAPEGLASAPGAVPGSIVLDDSFTEPAMESALRDGHPVVHIATHFHLEPGDADESLLLLGDGTLVNVNEIRKLKGVFQGVELLTLSACDTAASGPAADGKEVECFGTIAQNKGAKAVLASLWPVDDRSTSALMQEFYRLRETQSGVAKVEAMRQAQVTLLRGTLKVTRVAGENRALVHEEPSVSGRPAFKADPKAPFAHPYYWAPFVLIGNWK